MGKEKKTKSKPTERSDGSAAASGLAVTDVALAERMQIQATRVICSSDMNYNVSNYNKFCSYFPIFSSGL
jgi:hypothetical protein